MKVVPVGPWKCHVLLPPSGRYGRDVEAQNETERDHAQILVEIAHQLLECSVSIENDLSKHNPFT